LVDVTITDKGQKLLKKLDAESYDMDQIMNQLTEKEGETLNLLLDKLRHVE
jgi:DNA-binding MarR family transcriptional regulator